MAVSLSPILTPWTALKRKVGSLVQRGRTEDSEESITLEFVRERLKDGSIDLCGRTLNKPLLHVPIEVLVLLPQARKLDLCHNGIKDLLHTFSTLRHLTELDLHRNLLEKLPENFGQLSNLRRLDLHGNPLKTLPHAFWQLSRLEWLDLRENRFEKVDLKVAADVGRRCTEEKGHECAKKVLILLREEARTREMERHRIVVRHAGTSNSTPGGGGGDGEPATAAVPIPGGESGEEGESVQSDKIETARVFRYGKCLVLILPLFSITLTPAFVAGSSNHLGSILASTFEFLRHQHGFMISWEDSGMQCHKSIVEMKFLSSEQTFSCNHPNWWTLVCVPLLSCL